jgi:diguanylate cyclase (GGDEF)-like protein/PAS domain S-box-containing protein
MPAGIDRKNQRVLAIAAALAAAGLFAYLLWSGHQEARRDAASNIGNLTLAIESVLESTLRRTDAALAEVDSNLRSESLRPEVKERYRAVVTPALDAEVKRFPDLVTVVVLGPRGDPLYWSGAQTAPPVHVGGDECRRRSNASSDTPVFSEGLPAIEGRSYTIGVCRRLHGADGGVSGYAVALLSLDALRNLFGSLDLGMGGVAEIRRGDDFRLVLRWPEVVGQANQPSAEGDALRDRLQLGDRSGTVELEAQVDHIPRIVGFRAVDGFPFVVSVALSRTEVLTEWILRMTLIGALVVAMLATVWALHRHLRDTSVVAGSVRRSLEEQGERLRVSEAQLGEAMDMSRMAYWEYDVATNRFGFNDRLLALMQSSLETIGGYWLAADGFIDQLVEPEDGPRLREEIGRCLLAMAPKQIFSCEARLRCGDGGSRSFALRFHYMPAGDGVGARLRGAAVDVDEARRAESQLRLLANVFEYSGEAIVVTDADNRIVSINRSFSRLTGYEIDEVRGQNPRILSAGRMPPNGYRMMWQDIAEKGGWEGEIWDRRKDGSCYPKWLTISTLKDAAGKITHHIGSFTDISERKLAEERIYHLAHHDTLTGLPNRFSLHNRLSQAIVSVRRENRSLAVMFLDLDHFKTINDTLGHPVGDRLLIEVALRLKDCVRESDVVARLGGDEFVVVMTDISDAPIGAVSAMASKIQQRLTEPCVIDGRDLHATPSIGIAVFPSDGDDADALMKNADVAMYHAKSRGRHNYQFFTASMNEAAAERVELEGSLRQAIDGGEMLLHYQPQIDAVSGRVVGVEALVRWQHPSRGMVPPGKFIPLAEETGLIEPLGRWVLNAACQQLWTLARQGRQGLRMAVNLSARQLREENLVDHVQELLAAYGLSPGDLELEITESAAMENADITIGILRRLRDLGVALAIDDFGTGYSSLAYLKLLPIQRLKLDRSFVRDIETDHNDAIICSATIALAHSLGLEVVAEGVETEPQLTYLKYLGCDLIQGYYFSKPLPENHLVEFLDRHAAAAIAAAEADPES